MLPIPVDYSFLMIPPTAGPHCMLQLQFGSSNLEGPADLLKEMTWQVRKATDGEILTKVMLVRRGSGDDADHVEAAKGGVMTQDYCSKWRCPLSF